ncbi:hypothetical protein AM586_01035 [Massilia sp. WG5]|nr:hypothetical protein AM586_01035 [Massilia sp. WG5]
MEVLFGALKLATSFPLKRTDSSMLLLQIMSATKSSANGFASVTCNNNICHSLSARMGCKPKRT